MENTHVYLDTSSGSEATISEQGTLTIRPISVFLTKKYDVPYN